MNEPSEHVEKHERRDFLKLLVGGATAAVALATRPETVDAADSPKPLEELPDGESMILRMQGELRRALAKPVEKRRWVMVIDLRKCVGCSACTIGCVAENKLPPGVVYRPVMEEEVGEYPNVGRRFLPRLCNQCDNPPCVPVCPVKATYKRPDGIVEINYEQCIGCRYCLPACPYGARTADFGEFYTSGTPRAEPYEKLPSHEYGREWPREQDKSPVGNARKCHFCIHRLDAGMLPACVTTCIGYATYFGDANDPESLVSELIARPNAMRLKEELGTKPRVYYLV
ncbi:MAG TPA: 4Fe-4S dicluster domain-containing protein [candidate division Zixibacteria bacterium]|nr:4Fe-4S dicluster domain-containing protein [candidate division Zixibacteria bacterium]